MADVSDPQILDSYNDVRSDATETNWAKFVYEGNNKIVAGPKGSGGLAELQQQFSADEAAYAYARVTTGDSESKRAKFIFIAWGGDHAKVLLKAKMSVHRASLKEVVKEFALEIFASDNDDLAPERVTSTVIKAGGANYHGQGV